MNRIPGNIHFSFHDHENVVYELRKKGIYRLDLSHHINKFDIDEESSLEAIKIRKAFGDRAKINPLSNTKLYGPDGNSTFVYYLNVVRTVYGDGGKNYTLNQYTVSKYQSNTKANGIPAVYMRFEIAPIYVYYSFRQSSLIHFIVRTIAIIGGVITVAGIVVSFLQTSAYQIGKTFT